jgi:hypothetical protein
MSELIACSKFDSHLRQGLHYDGGLFRCATLSWPSDASARIRVVMRDINGSETTVWDPLLVT